MVENKLEPEVLQIIEYIKNGENFLLSGGAGSGKTYSLVQVIKKVIEDNPKAKVACITYTNVGVKEIKERVNHNNLVVSTIHDFLWDNIKNFQKELKKGLITLINDENSKIKSHDDKKVEDSYFDLIEDGIQYKEHIRIKEGIISHDEVLELANYMFKTYRLLCDILKDKYKFIFIDEYQDTSSLVIEIFLKHFENSKKKNIIGFFGDAMQSIYEDGIGDLKSYIDLGKIKEVQKKQNRRNPQLVIELANKLRTDGLLQEPSKDNKAPNMIDGVVKNGNIIFLYSTNNNLDEIKKENKDSIFKNWDFDNAKQTKELNLTNNLIATKAGFSKLMEIYDKDPIINFRNEVVKKIKDDNLIIDDSKTFEEVSNIVPVRNRQRQRKIDLIMQDTDSNFLYKQLKDLPFFEVKKIYLNKDSLIDDKKQDEENENKKGSKRDDLIKHLFKIQDVIHLYDEKRYNEFIRKTEYKITSIAKKREIKKIIEDFKNYADKTIGEIIDFADKIGICKKDDKFNKFINNENKYIYSRVKEVEYKEFHNLYRYLEGFTPFSTQHKTKGDEFDNVLVVLDNGGWNNYNFEYLFTNRIDKGSVLSRTQKIFYVCCTRAKENLIVFYHNPSKEVIEKAKEWFGEEKVLMKQLIFNYAP
ncbi:MAG: DNA/RNA helicase [Spirochaetes bacterium GWD1_27_9]|nr:MAG: DNA/RNA helicase [Spirochaetes bacterium GWB1_27_13]OHD25374.1 MAG: DNA/RNA helicase [Spirochaetes bacterium GWC1_27_15]OHD37139.1 MAG: DNA/RNA helicase [Spirochaetes bacterium GWD1_27_9]